MAVVVTKALYCSSRDTQRHARVVYVFMSHPFPFKRKKIKNKNVSVLGFQMKTKAE